MGGKSRKSGGVSKKLIALIKKGSYSSNQKEKTTKDDTKKQQPLFDYSETMEDNS